MCRGMWWFSSKLMIHLRFFPVSSSQQRTFLKLNQLDSVVNAGNGEFFNENKHFLHYVSTFASIQSRLLLSCLHLSQRQWKLILLCTSTAANRTLTSLIWDDGWISLMAIILFLCRQAPCVLRRAESLPGYFLNWGTIKQLQDKPSPSKDWWCVRKRRRIDRVSHNSQVGYHFSQMSTEPLTLWELSMSQPGPPACWEVPLNKQTYLSR